MKNLFKFIAFAVVLGMPFAAQAQNEPQTKKGPYVTNGFWDNWFMSVGAGVQGYFGEFHTKGDTYITPAFDLSVGKWVTPVWGARMQVAGLTAKSATINGNNPFVDGRYDNTYYNLKMKYMHYHVDALFNLSAAFWGYKPDRVYELIPFVGFGGISTYSGPSSHELAFDAGILNKFRISEHFDINLELRGALFNQRFDAQWGGNRGEGIGSITAGITYRFGKKPFKRASELMTDLTPFNNRISDLEDELAASKAKQAALEKALKEAESRPAVKEEIIETPYAGTAVFFVIGRTDISAEGKIVLDEMAETIKASNGGKFIVTGYADKETGSAARNMQLSQQRAQNVHDYLVSKGVNPDQLDVIAMGSKESPYSKPYLNRVVIIKK